MEDVSPEIVSTAAAVVLFAELSYVKFHLHCEQQLDNIISSTLFYNIAITLLNVLVLQKSVPPCKNDRLNVWCCGQKTTYTAAGTMLFYYLYINILCRVKTQKKWMFKISISRN